MSHGTERIDVYYRGQVQGVGFRYTTRAAATSCNVTGFVRNLPDGRVHVVVEGEQDEVARFLEQIQDRLGHYIRESQSSISAATGEFTDFEVAF